MKIIHDYPPNIAKVHAAFNVKTKRGVLYTYGDGLYNPSGASVSQPLLEHEQVHMAQQEQFGGPEAWWDKYIQDSEFRLHQELQAHKAEWRCFCHFNKDRNARTGYLNAIGNRLASGMYGGLVTAAQARQVIAN